MYCGIEWMIDIWTRMQIVAGKEHYNIGEKFGAKEFWGVDVDVDVVVIVVVIIVVIVIVIIINNEINNIDIIVLIYLLEYYFFYNL